MPLLVCACPDWLGPALLACCLAQFNEARLSCCGSKTPTAAKTASAGSLLEKGKKRRRKKGKKGKRPHGLVPTGPSEAPSRSHSINSNPGAGAGAGASARLGAGAPAGGSGDHNSRALANLASALHGSQEMDEEVSSDGSGEVGYAAGLAHDQKALHGGAGAVSSPAVGAGHDVEAPVIVQDEQGRSYVVVWRAQHGWGSM